MNLTRYSSYSREEIHNIYSPDSKFVPGAGKWGLHGIISIPNTIADFIFFVTFGTTEAGHTFKEGITEDGVLTWQSKPGQRLSDPQINKFINHDHNKNNIHLLLRTSSKVNYTYLGKLAYESHNPEKEKPVQFQWQILDWRIEKDLFEMITLELEDLEIDTDPYTTKPSSTLKNQLIKSDRLPFVKKRNNSIKPGTKIVNVDFLKKAIASKKNGDLGELLVIEYEQNKLNGFGIKEKIKHVSMEGDGHGYDIESYDEKGQKIFIEVKTTTGGLNTAIDISSNEVFVSNEHKDKYYIYRLYNYSLENNTADFYSLNGPISDHFDLQPTQFKASFKVDTDD